MQVTELVEYTLWLTAALATAGVGHNAVGAKVVAAAHDRDEAAHLAAAHAGGYHVAIGLGGREVGVDGLVTRLGTGSERGQLQVGIGAGHDVDVVFCDEHILHALGHAANDAYEQPATTLATQGVELIEAGKDALLGIVAHRAGVDKYGIGLVEVLARVVTGHLHDRGHQLAVGHIHLASVGLQIQLLGELPRCPVVTQFHVHNNVFLTFAAAKLLQVERNAKSITRF